MYIWTYKANKMKDLDWNKKGRDELMGGSVAGDIVTWDIISW